MLPYLRRIDPFIQGMIECGKVIEVFGNTSPILAYIWAKKKVNIKTSSNAIKVLEKLLDSYESIGERLPQFQKYFDMFRDNLDVRRTISAILEDILRFHKYAMKIFTRKASSWRLIFESTWNNLKEPLDLILSDLERHKAVLTEEGLLAHYAEMRMDREKELLEREAKLAQDDDRLKDDIRRWLAPADFQSEHDRQQEIVRKTILASHVITHLQATNTPTSTKTAQHTSNVTIAYFYCKEGSDPPATYDSVIRTLMWQLLHQNPDILRYFDSERNRYIQVPLRRIEDLKELLKNVIAVIEDVFIVIDGLDEVEPDQRVPLLEVLLTLNQAQNMQGASKIKIFLSSQVVVDIRESLVKFDNRIGCPILITDSQADIRQYIDLQFRRIKSKFDLTEGEAAGMATTVSSNVESKSSNGRDRLYR
ncbi:hypothetical protein TWF696_001412 [Orbilia brochopaga]|uniref:Nephrocystin 3-like N-terminal domain-containing protein n=1 Tax=Orbilia brochopaga TaxID=3140254 RepID=A0AAV9UA95_9PEZI